MGFASRNDEIEEARAGFSFFNFTTCSASPLWNFFILFLVFYFFLERFLVFINSLVIISFFYIKYYFLLLVIISLKIKYFFMG